MVAELKEVISKVEKLDQEEQKRIAELLEKQMKLENKKDGAEYDEEYLKSLRDKAKKSWPADINPDEWLKEVRGGYDQ